jgi:hypothetical protein
MECSEPGAIRDEELVAYLAGETVRPVVVEHLAHCQRCSLQLATYRRVELELLSKLYRWDCPPSQVLGEYQMGMLQQGQGGAVKNHLRACVLCTAEVATLTEFLLNDPMLAQPVTVIPNAASPATANNHRTSPAANNRQPVGARFIAPVPFDQLREQSLAGVRRIVAALLPPQPRLAYQRNASSQSAQWPRRYAAEDVTITVQVERDASRKDTLQLIGFVTQKGTTVGVLRGNTVQLSVVGVSGKTLYTQTIDELGNFVFSALSPADYTLELQLPTGIVVIDELSLTVQE